jgi:hypothetical protein
VEKAQKCWHKCRGPLVIQRLKATPSIAFLLPTLLCLLRVSTAITNTVKMAPPRVIDDGVGAVDVDAS